MDEKSQQFQKMDCPSPQPVLDPPQLDPASCTTIEEVIWQKVKRDLSDIEQHLNHLEKLLIRL